MKINWKDIFLLFRVRKETKGRRLKILPPLGIIVKDLESRQLAEACM